jgi:hypothetical protein
MATRRNILSALIATAALATALTAIPARAHSEHGKPQYGGVVGEAGVFQVELVSKPDSLTLYVTDHGKTVSVKGASANLTLLSGTTKTEASLKPSDDGTKLEAKGAFNVVKGTKVIAMVTLAGKSPASARFEVK